VHAGFEMASAQLPAKAQQIHRSAVQAGARVLSEETHDEIMEELALREERAAGA
jgi:hypothetical protein